MYDNYDNLYNMLNSYTTTEQEQSDSYTAQKTTDDTYSSVEKQPYVDDYSTAQNYQEEQSYNYNAQESSYDEEQRVQIRQMDKPVILKQEQTVTLTKQREKLYLSTRAKFAVTFCSVIVLALLFMICWNFISATRLQSTFSAKQAEISELSQSINDLSITYNKLSDPENIRDSAHEMGYVEKVDGLNSITISMNDFYVEPEIEKLSTNWFDDVCNFFNKLFA